MGVFNKNEIREDKLVVDCDPRPKEEGILDCKFFIRDENGQHIPLGRAKWEQVGPNSWRNIEHSGFTVKELNQLEEIIKKRILK
jgi:hypothetical protein